MEYNSPISGRVTIKDGTITVMGADYSSPHITRMWLDALATQDIDPKTCLVLGLAGGSIVAALKQLWPNITIDGVDIDEGLMELVGPKGINIIIDDAINHPKKFYDLIIENVYVCWEKPEKFRTKEYIKKLSSNCRWVLYNHYYPDHGNNLMIWQAPQPSR